MATHIDDIRYEPPSTRTKVLETIVLTLAVPATGWLFHEHDLLFLDSAFSWLIIAPLLAGIRYGFVYGFSSALATVGLMVMAEYGWLTSTEQVSHVAVSYAVGVVLIGMLAGEVADIWQRRLSQMSIANTTQATRLETFVRHYHLLRVSHDQLTERLAASPHTLRDALLQLAEQFQQLTAGEDALRRHAGNILSFLAIHGRVQQGALYRVAPNGNALVPEVIETYGGTSLPPVDTDHAMIRACLKQRRMICLKSEMAQSLPDSDTSLLAVVPLIDLHNRIWAVVTITEMPFIDFHRGQLHLLAVLGANLGDLIRNAEERLPAESQAARHQFIATLKRWIQYARRYGLSSQLVTLEMPSQLKGEELCRINALILGQLRSLDAGWAAMNENGSRLYILMPLTIQEGACAYHDRINHLLHEHGYTNAFSEGFAFRCQPVDGKRSLGAILRRADKEEANHAAA